MRHEHEGGGRRPRFFGHGDLRLVILDILTRNYNYRNKSARLYELARVYLRRGGRPGQRVQGAPPWRLRAGTWTSTAMKGPYGGHSQGHPATDIHLRAHRRTLRRSYHPGRCATVWSGSNCIGIFGQIHPLAAQNYGVDAELYCAELSFDELLNAKGPDPEYVPLPRFPAVTRDIAVVCGEKVTVGALEDCIRRGAKGLLKEVALFDI